MLIARTIAGRRARRAPPTSLTVRAHRRGRGRSSPVLPGALAWPSRASRPQGRGVGGHHPHPHRLSGPWPTPWWRPPTLPDERAVLPRPVQPAVRAGHPGLRRRPSPTSDRTPRRSSWRAIPAGLRSASACCWRYLRAPVSALPRPSTGDPATARPDRASSRSTTSRSGSATWSPCPTCRSASAPGVTALLGPERGRQVTMLRMLCGLTPPSQGTVRVLGGDPRRDPTCTGRIGLVPQQEAVFEGSPRSSSCRLAAVLLHGLPTPTPPPERPRGRRARPRPTATIARRPTRRACASG
jgi:hypothetical protein